MKCVVCKRELETIGGYTQHMKAHARRGEAISVEKIKPEIGNVTKYAWSSPIVYLKKK